MRKLWKRVRVDIIWVVVLLVIAAAANHYALGLSGWSQIGLNTASVLAALVISRHHWLWRRIVKLIRAIKLLDEQENNPKRFVWPYVKDIDFYPDRLEGLDLGYITITLVWINSLYYKAKIRDIKGTFSIVGSYPPDAFCSNQEINLEPFEWSQLNPTPIIVNIKHKTLKIVKDMRDRKSGKGSYKLNFSAKVNNKDIDFEIVDNYYYIH